jgi:hypothetical protein
MTKLTAAFAIFLTRLKLFLIVKQGHAVAQLVEARGGAVG